MTQLEQDDFEDLLKHPGLKPLLSEIERMVQLIEQDVIKYNLEGGSDKELAFKKCRAEGSRKLAVAINARLKPPKTLPKKS
jgi:hypothetical protein